MDCVDFDRRLPRWIGAATQDAGTRKSLLSQRGGSHNTAEVVGNTEKSRVVGRRVGGLERGLTQGLEHVPSSLFRSFEILQFTFESATTVGIHEHLNEQLKNFE